MQSLRRAPPPDGRVAPEPSGRCRAAQRGEREQRTHAAGAGQPSRTQFGRSRQSLVRCREPRSDVEQGEEAEGPQPRGRREARPAHSSLGPGLPFPPWPLLLPTPFPGLAWALGRRDRHLHHGSGDHPGHHLPGGSDPTSRAGGRRALADQASKTRPRARQFLALPGAALAPSGAGPGVCARELLSDRSLARPRPSPPAG